MESQTIPHRNEGMYLRLEKASHAGDLEELHRLLQEDGLLLHRPNTLHPADSPLHIAAALGHAHFVKEILARKPECALGFNTQGLTVLHLACANGHLMVVRELLQSSIGVEICCVRDRYGLLPIHTAALTGNVPVLEELLGACSDDVVRGLTCFGDSILHLVVKSNSFEAVKFLVERLESCHHELLSLRDAKGNTILHLATARKQLQTMKFLLDKGCADVNSTNKKGFSVLDVLLESPSEHGDLLLGEMIRAAGGTTKETMQPVETHQPNGQAGVSSNPSVRYCKNWKGLKTLFKIFPFFSCKDPDEFKETQNTLMVVATLIATVTFQGGLNPPGGFAQFDDTGKGMASRSNQMRDGLIPGQALMADDLGAFLLCDVVALLSSLSIILLMICGCPRWKYMINISMAITWIAVFSTGLAFFFAIHLIFPSNRLEGKILVLFMTWYSIMNVFISYKLIRLHIFMHGKIFQYIRNMKTRRGVRSGCFVLCMNHPLCLLLIRICMVISCFVFCVFVAFCGVAFLCEIRRVGKKW